MGGYPAVTPNIDIVIEMADALGLVGDLDENTTTALVRALNKGSAKIRTQMDKMVREEVNFPASYLRPKKGRLYVSQKAGKTSLQTTITGQSRPTSLARFIKSGTPLPGSGKRPKDGEISLQVKTGKTTKIKGAWLVRLPGNADSKNLGLAIRTPEGQRPRGGYAPKQLAPNVWLIYGPSIQQVLYSATASERGVIVQVQDDAMREVEAEYNRQMDLLESKK
jgi:hypothetical protein